MKTNQKFKLGAYYRDLTTKERQINETNTGVIIMTVIEGTPAFKANLIPGDVVITVNRKEVDNYSKMNQIINSPEDLTNISFIRNGEKMNILFHLEQPTRKISSEK